MRAQQLEIVSQVGFGCRSLARIRLDRPIRPTDPVRRRIRSHL